MIKKKKVVWRMCWSGYDWKKEHLFDGISLFIQCLVYGVQASSTFLMTTVNQHYNYLSCKTLRDPHHLYRSTRGVVRFFSALHPSFILGMAAGTTYCGLFQMMWLKWHSWAWPCTKVEPLGYMNWHITHSLLCSAPLVETAASLDLGEFCTWVTWIMMA